MLPTYCRSNLGLISVANAEYVYLNCTLVSIFPNSQEIKEIIKIGSTDKLSGSEVAFNRNLVFVSSTINCFL